MERYICVILFFIVFSFQQSEGKVVVKEVNKFEDETNATVLITENLKFFGLTEECSSKDDVWSCCVGIETKLNITVCFSLAYLKEEVGLELNVTLNDYLICHKKVSVRNPPPVCFHVPYLEKIANACFRIYDLDDKNKTLTGCVNFEVHIEGLKLFKVHIGCFSLPMSWLGKESLYSVRKMEQPFG